MFDPRDVRDSFLHFLADNLTDIPIHPIRDDPREPSSSVLQINAVNVEFLALNLKHVGFQQVCLDVCHDTEDTAMEWIANLWQLLGARFFTPLTNYTNPANPRYLGSNLMWDIDSVKFMKVQQEVYSHYACTIALRFRAV